MQIQPLYLDLKTLLAGRLFRIPEYQRAYSWTTKQRDDLFDDLRKLASAGKTAEHFMAAIVGLRRKKIKIQADQFTEIEVVDGQQRLTTIAILLKAIVKGFNRKNDVQSRLANDLEELLVKRDKASPLLVQTNQDLSSYFSEYMRRGTHPAANQATAAADRNLLEGIEECESFVQEWKSKGSNALVDLTDMLRNRLTLILHEIDDEGLVYTVFEVLNSRGLDVTSFDKLKSLLMAIAFECGGGNKRAIIRELHQLWTEIYRIIGLRQVLNKETVRFAGTLAASEQPSRPVGEETAISELISACKSSPAKVLDTTKWLQSLTAAETKILSNHRWRGVTGIVQARLVAIAVLLRRFPSSEEDAILQRWENVTFRIYGMAGRDSRAKVGEYVRLAWQISNEKLKVSKILEELKELGKDYPIAASVKGLLNEDCYDGWGEELRYFFFRYEEYLARKQGQKLNVSQWNRIWTVEPSRSIEHICPQSKGHLTRSASGIFVHRLGNLVLLPPDVNSGLKDKSPKEKATRYRSCGLLASAEIGNTLKSNDGKWDRAAVERRERKLVRWAVTEWGD